MLIDKSRAIRISAKISEEELNAMLSYIQGEVYGYTVKGSDEWFV